MNTFTDWHTAGKVIQEKDMPTDQFWSNAEVSYLNYSDNKLTTISLNIASNKNTTTSLVVSNFGFSIPDDSIIKGVEVKVRRVASVVEQEVYTVKDIINFIGNTYEYPPKGINGGKFIKTSKKAFKTENWDGNSPINRTEELQYPEDDDLYETIILGSTGEFWNTELTNLNINSSDFLFALKVGLYGSTKESIYAAIDSIEMRIEYYYVEPSAPPIG